MALPMMKPLHIPLIRRLDLTESYWLKRAAWRRMGRRLMQGPVIIPPSAEDDFRRHCPGTPWIVNRPLP